MANRLFKIAGGLLLLGAFASGAIGKNGPRDCDHPDPSRSIKGCTAVIEDKSSTADLRARALLKRGIGHFASRQLDLAIADFEAARQINPNDLIAYNELGLSYQMKGDMTHALEAFDAGLKLFPDDGSLHYNRGQVYEQLNDLDKAIADYQAAVELKPGERIGFLDTGKVEMIAAARLKSNHHGRLANAYAAKGDLERAAATYENAIAVYPRNPRIYFERSKLFVARGDLAGARTDLDLAVKLEPQWAPIYTRRAMVAFQTDDFQQAAADYAQAWQIDRTGAGLPKDYIPLWHYIMLGRSDVNAASRALRERLPAMDQSAWPFPIAKMLLGQQSIAQTLEAAITAEERCEAEFYSGELLLLQGDTAAARAALTRAHDSCPNRFIEFKGAQIEIKRMASSGR